MVYLLVQIDENKHDVRSNLIYLDKPKIESGT